MGWVLLYWTTCADESHNQYEEHKAHQMMPSVRRRPLN